MSYFNRKFHLSYTMSDGNVWRGFINVYADTLEELPNKEDIQGSFWVSKTNEGWLGEFRLETTVVDKRKNPNPYGWKHSITNAVITIGIYKPEITPINSSNITPKEAYDIYRSTLNISDRYATIYRLEDYLEDCIIGEETHCWN